MKKSRNARTVVWIVFAWIFLPVLSLVQVKLSQAGSSQHIPHSGSAAPEMLTLDGPARFLIDVADLTWQPQIPEQLLRGHGLFSQTVRPSWIGQINSAQFKAVQLLPMPRFETSPTRLPLPEKRREHQFAQPILPKKTLSSSDLSDTIGRGSDEAPPNSVSSASTTAGEEPETIGEKPTETTAEETALRGQQVLLTPQELSLELNFGYTRTDRNGLTAVPDPIRNRTFLGDFTGETDLFIWGFVARYGLPKDVLLVANLPLIHRRQKTTASAPGTTITNETRSSRTETGRLSLSVRRTFVRAGVGHPQVILSLRTLIPTYKSSYGIGGSISLIKRIDPVALLANVSYTHTFSREFNDATRLRPKNVVNLNYGFAFSINEHLAMSTSILGTFTTRTTFENGSIPAIERFFLRTSVTTSLTKGVFMEPFVIFSLNGRNSVTLGLNIPYTFDISPYIAEVF